MIKMDEEKTISYFYNKDTKTYTISDKEMQKINRKLKEKFTLKQENQRLKEENERYRKLGFKYLNEQNNQLKEVIEEVREYINNLSLDFYDYECNQLIVGNYMINDLLQILDKVKEVKQ